MVYPGQPHYTDFKAPILQRPIDDPGRKLRVICVGAGISGVTTAIRFPQHLGKNIDLQIYEKNPDIGGVWLENHYPGVACDIPAPCFSFLFEDNPNWSDYYAKGGEIVGYIRRVAEKYKCRKYMKFQHLITDAVWHEQEGKWKIKVHDKANNRHFDDECDIFILAWGMLNNWEWPNVPGLHSFKGPYMHSADYNDSFDSTGKRVAVVGGGSSGIQILPHIQKTATHVDHYMRSHNWIAPVGFGAIELEKRGKLDEGNFQYTDEEKETFKKDPVALHKHRREVEDAMNDYMTESGFTYGTPRQQAIQKLFDETMKRKLEKKPEILKTLLPTYPPGCRRLTPGPGYLEALIEPNVEFIPNEIKEIVEDGIITDDGILHKVDAIIWATGFRVDFVSRFPMVGRDGITWNQVMDPEPEAYMGSIVDKMPNVFCYMGPNCGPGAGGAYLCVEGECELMIACVKKLLREKIKSICIKTERVKQYAAHVHSYLKGSIFGQPCKSWFKRGKEDGRNLAYYAGNALNLLYAQRNPKWEDFDYTYCDELQGNSVSWLANGYTVADYDGSSRTKYLDPSFIDYPPIPEDEDEPVSLEAKEESSSTNSINSLGGAIIQDAATQGVKIDSKAALFGVANA